uniref:Uncharacterized protein n=1 Tax=Arundo donax TaxID=35708 RepID=A0A0A9ALR0_ARUDO
MIPCAVCCTHTSLYNVHSPSISILSRPADQVAQSDPPFPRAG